ncbi:MAG: type II toxin-antitoxin system RelE/ParE family toxin [Prevotellaceae bacterium]|jgi:proteic killer suppression protein|nr:type II toxin-antitoxin system RelE/ParE family toxin [Prevotellaceae bacterium]
MEIVFEKEYLSELYYHGKTLDKKHRFQPEVIKRYKLRIEALESADSIEDLYRINAFHYELLKGDKKGISSIRVNDRYRIEFTTHKVESETVVTVCNILELSNHYNK